MGAFKAQHAAWAASHTLAAGQAVTIANRLAAPGVMAYINADGTVVRANAALNASSCFGHDIAFRQHDIPFEIKMQRLGL